MSLKTKRTTNYSLFQFLCYANINFYLHKSIIPLNRVLPVYYYSRKICNASSVVTIPGKLYLINNSNYNKNLIVFLIILINCCIQLFESNQECRRLLVISQSFRNCRNHKFSTLRSLLFNVSCMNILSSNPPKDNFLFFFSFSIVIECT